MPRMIAFPCVSIGSERFAAVTAPRSGASPRLVTALLAVLAIAGCTTDLAADYLFGIGDPVRGAALYAPHTLGDTSRWAGRPADAAIATTQLEFLARELATHPRYAAEVSPAVLQQVQMARGEMRGYLGIAPTADPEVVILGLRRAAEALRSSSPARAEAALTSPAFTAGPAATLGRLARMPRLPRTGDAAGAVSNDIARMDRR
jgi:hypothetical protein